MEVTPTLIPGCFELAPAPRYDARGAFVKTLEASFFAERGLDNAFSETFFTVSQPRVLRGMHLQLPPADQAKVVFCISGEVLDIVLDVRRGSPSFHQHVAMRLTDQRFNGVFIPRGVAHGFYVTRGPATLLYQVTAEYSPALDVGIDWQTVGLPWPDPNPLVSERDTRFPSLERFETPFHFREDEA